MQGNEFYQERSDCRICGGRLKPVLELGDLYPSMFVDADAALPERAPLTLAKCADCDLVQLAHEFTLDALFRRYYYQSGINPSMVAALKNVVDEAMARVELRPGDVVCDIASNDGTTLSFYPAFVTRVGFDPAQNLPVRAAPTHFVNDYFNAEAYAALGLARARIVTSLAMFYDLPDPRQFVADVTRILAPDGLWIVQISDLCSMLRTNSIDNPCQEHAEYYCTEDILNLMIDAGLEVVRIEHNEVNSGSLRFYIAFKGVYPVEASVEQTRAEEARYLASAEGSLDAFAARVNAARTTLLAWLKQSRRQGYSVYGLAASTKGNTLLQYFSIDPTLVRAIGELNEEKFGKVTIGTRIPIVSEDAVLAARPDALLVLSWHFLPFFLEKLRDYMRAGGKLIVPLPEPRAYFTDGFGLVDSLPLAALVEVEPRIAVKTSSALIDELFTILLRCWHYQEVVMHSADDRETARAARLAQATNDRRNQLKIAIDQRLGEGSVTEMTKTYTHEEITKRFAEVES